MADSPAQADRGRSEVQNREYWDTSRFSDFSVRNPKTQRTYRVSIGGEGLGVNYCSCPDFAVNTIGTCKHVESVLNKLRRQKGGRTALREGAQWNYSAVTLRYGLQRKVAFSSGRESSEGLKALAADFFDKDHYLTAEGFANFDRFVKQAGALKDDVRYHDDALEFLLPMSGTRACGGNACGRCFHNKRAIPGGNRCLKRICIPINGKACFCRFPRGAALSPTRWVLGKTIQAIAAGLSHGRGALGSRRCSSFVRRA